MVIGMTLREYITSGRGTTTQIGQATGVSEHGVRKWVYGQREPDIDTALTIERHTDGLVTVAELSKSAASGQGATVETDDDHAPDATAAAPDPSSGNLHHLSGAEVEA